MPTAACRKDIQNRKICKLATANRRASQATGRPDPRSSCNQSEKIRASIFRNSTSGIHHGRGPTSTLVAGLAHRPPRQSGEEWVTGAAPQSGLQPASTPVTSGETVPGAGKNPTVPVIGGGDLLKVSVLGVPESDQEVRVGADGQHLL